MIIKQQVNNGDKTERCEKKQRRLSKKGPTAGHMEKQEMEMKWKLETETGNGNWKWKLETEMGTKNTPITGVMFPS